MSILIPIDSKKPTVPLILESHPKDYTGYPFLTLVQYHKVPMLVIVDNRDGDTVKVFVLDMCSPEGVDEEMLFKTAIYWYENNRNNFPISIEFSKMGIAEQTSKIYRVLNLEFVSRVIGPFPLFPMNTVKSIKRRRRKVIPTGIEIVESSALDDLSVEDTFE
jgi:hypothetical protein